MSSDILIQRAEKIQAQYSQNPDAALEPVTCLAFEAFAECGAPYLVRPITDTLEGKLRKGFLQALDKQVEAPGNRDSLKAGNLRTYVAVGLLAFRHS